MRYFKKIQCFFIALVFILATVPLKIYADDPVKFDVVGWREDDHHHAVKSVKVNGVELSEYNPSMYISRPEVNRVSEPAESTLNVEITLEDGYTLRELGDGVMLCLGGVQTGSNNVKNSRDTTSIQLPDENQYTRDQELYLVFATERVFNEEPTSINSITLSVPHMTCGTKINDATDPAPDITVPSDGGYTIAPNSACWLKKEGVNYVENEYPLTAKKVAYFKVDLLDRGPYIFSEDLNDSNITINGGKLLDYEMDTFGGPDLQSTAHRLCLTIGMDLEHIAGKAKKEDIIPATCTKPGQHDNVVRCKYCEEELDREGPITDKAIGHKWGKWKVIKEPTIYEEGKKQRICKNDSSHVQTRTIPRLDSRMVTFDTQGHGETPEPQRIAVGETASEPENMYAAGYVFGGWFMDSKCTTPFDFSTPITEDITLYANWIPSAYGYLRTGDSSNIALWSTLLGLSLSVMAFITIKKNRIVFEKTK